MKFDIPETVRSEMKKQAEQIPQLLTNADMSAALADVAPEHRGEFQQVWWAGVIEQNLAEVAAYLARQKRELAGTQPQTKPSAPRTKPAVTSSNPLLANKLTIPEAATLLGVGTTNLRAWILSGAIPVIKFGGKYLLYERDLAKFIATRYGALKTTPKKKGRATYRASSLLGRSVKM
ncbi:MAG: helix-turn-helix domain-containing protein [bacterium]